MSKLAIKIAKQFSYLANKDSRYWDIHMLASVPRWAIRHIAEIVKEAVDEVVEEEKKNVQDI